MPMLVLGYLKSPDESQVPQRPLRPHIFSVPLNHFGVSDGYQPRHGSTNDPRCSPWALPFRRWGKIYCNGRTPADEFPIET